MLGCRPVQHQASNFKTAELELCSGETFRATTVVPYYVVATEHGSLWVHSQPSGSKAVDVVDLELCSGETFRATTMVPYYVVATEHGSKWVQPQPSGSKAVDAADFDMCSGETLGAAMFSL